MKTNNKIFTIKL